jgi:hypothetical protein
MIPDSLKDTPDYEIAKKSQYYVDREKKRQADLLHVTKQRQADLLNGSVRVSPPSPILGPG